MVLQKLQLLSVACPLCRLDVRETFSGRRRAAPGGLRRVPASYSEGTAPFRSVKESFRATRSFRAIFSVGSPDASFDWRNGAWFL